MQTRPDVLVLGSGGVLGEAWLTGVLAGLEDGNGYDLRECEHFVGTSAGAVVAARLASGLRPRRPPARSDPTRSPPTAADPGGANADPDQTVTDPGCAASDPDDPGRAVAAHVRVEQPPRQSRTPPVRAAPTPAAALAERTLLGATEGIGAIAEWGTKLALAVGAPAMPTGLALAATPGALARAAALRALPRRVAQFTQLRDELADLADEFDGRLRVVAVARDSGRRTVFGRPGAPHATVLDAVQASCAVPWMVGPVTIGGVEYVDGGVWSPTNLDVAPALRDTQVLCLSPTAGRSGPNRIDFAQPSPLSPVARRVSRTATMVEAAALRGRHAAVDVIAPDADAAAAIDDDLMDPDRVDLVLDAGYRQGLRAAGDGREG